MSKKIGIIGAGIAGLACAIELKKQGHSVKVFESTSKVGGRIKTDYVDGYTFDHGFQVFLPSYERAKYFLDYKKLRLKKFKPGAKLQSSNGFEILSDPMRDFGSLFSTLKNSHTTFNDKLLILKLKKRCKGFIIEGESGETALSFLQNYGFSNEFINAFFKPFFSGVFLETELSTDKNFFLYLFDKFNNASATLPEKGMGAIPQQMAEHLSEDELSLSNSVISIGRSSIISEKDAVESFDEIVLAVSGDKISKFIEVPSSNFSSNMLSVSTHYFTTKSNAMSSKYLYLTKGKYVNHIACLTAANSNYAPAGENLFSVNVVNAQKIDSRFAVQDLESIFSKTEIDTWKHLKSYHISKALPKSPLYGNLKNPINGVYIASDSLQSPSIQGALESGYQVAQSILKNT